jgi:hypothetical protein
VVRVGTEDLRKYLARGWHDHPAPDHNLEDVLASFDALVDDLDEFIADRTEKNLGENRQVNSGGHLGTVRTWMQCRFINGDRVTWGSEELLLGTGLTVREMVAQRIADIVVAEERTKGNK